MGNEWQVICLFGLSFLCWTTAVDRSNFKTCRDSGFCRKNRELKNGDNIHELLLDTIQLEKAGTVFSAVVRNANSNLDLALAVSCFEDRTFRIKLNELTPQRIRHEVNISIDKQPEAKPISYEFASGEVWITLLDGIRVKLQAKPFQVAIFEKETLLVNLNAGNLLLFEPMRLKPSFLPSGNTENEKNAQEKQNDRLQKEEWHDETFKGHTDTKPFGENSVGLDVTLVGYDNVYGIPEHADSFRLRSTKETDPYRLYNLDVFEYEVDNPMALYGSIPFMMAHSSASTLGFFWNSAAETWIDIDYKESDTVTHWFSETGLIDMFFFLGPTPSDVSRQFTALVGRPFLPPFAMLGYHQSRWNYNNEKDVAAVQDNFDLHNIPLDTIWLDIEYADGKRYFTWDKTRFPHPKEMIANLTSKGRNMVLISDTHIKKDDDYFVYKHMKDKGYFVKTKEGLDYEGWCWPGASFYPDFLNPEVQKYYASLYSLDTFDTAWTWNDMNEPSVFNGPEVTMAKDNVHVGGWEHREVHNMYGMAHLQSTFKGHLKRSNGQLRPFILARAFFAGSQRFAAVWTGDNMAEWGHLQITSPMVLSMGVAGMTFTGADVGGFFKNPDVQLLIRWYQAGAFHPFFRAHSHMESKRREPYLYDERHLSIMRDAIQLRYTFLPFWYTLFFEASQTGLPMMRPLWFAFPEDRQTFTTDDAFLLGEALLIKPVTHQGATSVDVYFPGGATTRWYDVENLNSYNGGQTEKVDAPLSKIPVFQRSGTIIARRLRLRRSAALSIEDPLTLEVALDDRGTANGTVYLDDGTTRDHLKGEYVYVRMEMQDNVLTSRLLHTGRTYRTKVWLKRVQIVGFKSKPSSVTVKDSASIVENPLHFSYSKELRLLTVRKPGVSMASQWDLSIKV